MVIVSSDSNNTLVSLGNNALKRVGSLELLQQATTHHQNAKSDDPIEFVATHLYLPNEDEDDWGCEANDDDSFFSCEEQTRQPQQDVLYLPKRNTNNNKNEDHRLNVDECFSYLPCMMDSCDALLAQPAVSYKQDEQKTRFVYVGQGEVGHAVPLQCDAIMSDRATTCHILMLYSTSAKNVPLASCAHIDGTDYELETLFAKHAQHHKNCSSIEMDIHIVGGYQAADSSCTVSRDLSNWLVYELADMSTRYSGQMTCTLQTAAISSLNTSSYGTPIGRGVAMNTRTGRVWLANLENPATAQPEFIRRQAQLWFRSSDDNTKTCKKELLLVHQETANTVSVPFLQVPAFNPELAGLLQLPDEVLLQYTSTSPACEQSDFCGTVRQTIHFWKEHSSKALPPCTYKRVSGQKNQWIPLR